jgi:Bacterial SH3 domain
VGKIKTSGSRKAGIAWLFGGLISVCFLGSFLFSITPAGRESAAQSRATRTAVALAEATSETETRNAPTNTPSPTATLAPTETPRATDTPHPTETPSLTPESSFPTSTSEPASTQIPIVPLAIVKGTQLNVRSGPGTDYPVIQTLVQGDTAPATGFNSGRSWVQIELPDGTTGWVSADLVEIKNSDKISTVTNIPPVPVTTPSAQQPTSSGNGGSSGGNTDNPFQCVDGCASPPDPSCAIKGNVNSSGEKIYHVPGGAFYNRTDIKPEEGDRWFCTEAEAQAAGFRRSAR